jgi:two-component system cell cycle response regulator
MLPVREYGAEPMLVERRSDMLGLLQVVQGPDVGQSYPLPKGQKVLIGRGPNSWVNLSDQKVSRLHCQIVQEGDKVLLADTAGSSGTWVNGERIAERELQVGDVICVGDTLLSFKWTDSDEQHTDAWETARPS